MKSSMIVPTRVNERPVWNIVWTAPLTDVSAVVAIAVRVDGTNAATNWPASERRMISTMSATPLLTPEATDNLLRPPRVTTRRKGLEDIYALSLLFFFSPFGPMKGPMCFDFWVNGPGTLNFGPNAGIFFFRIGAFTMLSTSLDFVPD